MRQFGVPFDINQEDKIVGGMLSIRQCLWLSIPLGILIWAFMTEATKGILDGLAITLKSITFLLVASVAVFLAFGEMDGAKADDYVFRMIKFKWRKKIFKYGDKIR